MRMDGRTRRTKERARKRYLRSIEKLVRSVEGLGNSDASNLYFSPVLLTPENVQVVLHQTSQAVPPELMKRLRIIALSTVEAYSQYAAKVSEASEFLTESRKHWKDDIDPIKGALDSLEIQIDAIRDSRLQLRLVAVTLAAKTGLEFNAEDLASLASVQAMLERNGERLSLIGPPDRASLAIPLPLWARAISEVSPVLVSVLTAAGLGHLLIGGDIQTALGSPAFPLTVALALGITIPVLTGAYRLGWLIATSSEPSVAVSPTLRTRAALWLGSLAVAGTSLPIAAIDALGISALGEAASKATRDASPNNPWWLPLAGFAFMGSATVTKLWTGYCDSVEQYFSDCSEGMRLAKEQELRQMVQVVVGAIAIAEEIENHRVSLAELAEPKRQNIAGAEYSRELPVELILDAASARDSWIGESNRFWRTLWSNIPDGLVTTYTWLPSDPVKEPFWSRLFGRRKI